MDIITDEIIQLIVPYILMVILVTVIDLIKVLIIECGHSNKKVIAKNEVLNVVFYSYLILVLYLTLFISIGYFNETKEINLIPFRFLKDLSGHKSLLIYNIGGNIALFVPLGFMLPLILKRKGKLLTLPMLIILTLIIETIQYFIGRSSDIDDIVMNIIGAIIGFVLYLIYDKVVIKYKNKKAM